MQELCDQVRRDRLDEPLVLWRELREVRGVASQDAPAHRFCVVVQRGERRGGGTSPSPGVPARGLAADDRVRAVEVPAPG